MASRFPVARKPDRARQGETENVLAFLARSFTDGDGSAARGQRSLTIAEKF
ncbi:MAG: hypothetical protein R2838_20375 [Caldilineaceae bacterium]